MRFSRSFRLNGAMALLRCGIGSHARSSYVRRFCHVLHFSKAVVVLAGGDRGTKSMESTLDVSARGIPKACSRMQANGKTDPRSGEQGHMEPNGGEMGAMCRRC